MRRVYAILFLTTACSSNPVTPTTITPAKVPQAVQYDINIPFNNVAMNLKLQNPSGIFLSPIAAQQQFDYTTAYGGTPNVYAGETQPKCPPYLGAGIVIAPRRVASIPEFKGTDWPGIGLDPGTTYQWLGHFVYAMPAPAGTTVFNPACL